MPRTAVTVTGASHVTWYFSSERVRRGFCAICGSSMFFDILGVDRIGLNLGSFDGPTHTRIALHIFVADKGDYYDITDGLPQYAQVPGRPA